MSELKQIDILANQRICPNPLQNPNCEKVITHKTEKLCKLSTKNNRNCQNCRYYMRRSVYNIEKLLLNECESYYWIGFLLADGNFSDVHGISLSLALVDSEHLLKFCNFLNIKQTTVNRGMIVGRAMNKPIIDAIREKFNINNRKTYIPPDIEIFKNIDRKLMVSLITGFIDGDGSIFINSKNSKIVCLRITCHGSWVQILKLFATVLSPNAKVTINKRGHSVLNLSNTFELKKIKQEILEYNLPLLLRKWDRIDMENITTHEQSEISKLTAFKMFDAGMSITQISNHMNMSYKNIWKYFQKYKNQ